MRRILLSTLLLGFVSAAFLGTRGTTKLPGQLRFAVVDRLLQGQNQGEETEPHDQHWSQCGEVRSSQPERVISAELENTNVGAMLGRAGEEEILKPLTICENYRPTDRSS